MSVPERAPQGICYRFGPFELNTAEESLLRNGVRVKVQDLPFRLLVMLVERPGEIITREEVRQRLWTDDSFVEFDNSLGVAMRKVRDSQDDDAEAPRYLETIPRRGCRFVAPVGVVEVEKPKQYFEAAAKAQIALLEIEVGRPAESAQSRLTKLVESCRARGYIAIANSASAVLATSKAGTS
jgi:DNA-binding winged helix-turn-helix (wHTH) protein